jgi:hypothetical protein
MVTRPLLRIFGALVVASGCGLSPAASGSSGVNGLGGGASGACPAALTVVDSDYMSTNVSVVSPTGTVLSASIVSSASTPPGLTAALSGDVITPLAKPPSGDLVLIDRANGAIDWIDATTGVVKDQLSVATGFYSDPQDYLEVSATKAYVTRYMDNTTSSTMPFSQGGDVLIVDLTSHAITGRIGMTDPDDGALWPRPDRMLSVNGAVWVSLERLDATYMSSGDARIAGVDPSTDARTFELDLTGLVSCGGLAISPSGKVVAASCSGEGAEQTNVATSGIVLLDATQSPPVVLERFPTSKGGAVGPSIAFASETTLVGFLYGDLTITPPRNDVAFALDTTTGAMTTLLDAGAPFVLGDVKCTPGCADTCVMADAHANGLRVWDITASGLTLASTVSVDPKIGLPPRNLGEL